MAESTGQRQRDHHLQRNARRGRERDVEHGDVRRHAVSGFPANTPINIAHIHQGAAGVNGGIVFNTTLSATGDAVVLTNGSGTFTKSGVPQRMSRRSTRSSTTRQAYYFNVHSTLHPGGVARGQLAKVQ